jgi:lipopolysaccharide export LptBFGC system permease protein LptF
MQKGYTQYFAMAALALAVLGLGLAFTNAKTGGSGGLVAGILSAGALIALMINEKSNLKTSISNQAVDKAKDGADTLGFDKIGDSMNNIKPTLDFTPWFYVVVIAFLAAAFFCYKRMQSVK